VVGAGQTLSHYRLIEKIGEGGMGFVWRAEDTKLHRDVALKFLPDRVASNPQSLSRFQREARMLASLNDSNVAAIYEMEEAEIDTGTGSAQFLVLEYVPGVSLAERLEKGPLPIQEALRVCCDIARGLEAAHAKGLIHRDLKPGNVHLTPEGKVKVLDFGLAKALGEVATADEEAQQMTVTAATGEYTVVGTVPYMSPEQASAMPVDKRTDIWSFGCVLYELLTGRRAFSGDTISGTIAAIHGQQPDWDSLPAETPVAIRRLLLRCLKKDPDRRLRDIGDARIEIEESAESAGLDSDSADARQPSRVALRVNVALAAIAVVATAIALWSLLGSQPSSDSSKAVRRFEIDIGQARPIYDWSIVSELALSPDGTDLAYVARLGETSQLYIRHFGEVEATAVPDTEYALAPFFSPDGQWVAYYSADSVGKVNELRKVPVDGGPPQVLCNAWPPSGGTWLADDTIVFTSTEPFVDYPVWDGSVKWGLFQISANGGTPDLLTSVNRAAGGEAAHSRPRALPGGRAVLFGIRRTAGAWAQPGSTTDEPDWETATSEVALLDLESGDYRTLIENAHDADYSTSGHILFMRDQDLWAAPFDLDALAVSGAERIVRPGLQAMFYPQTNSPYALDADGSAVFLPAAELPTRQSTLVWVERNGDRERADVPPAHLIRTPRISPDGERILYTVQSATADIWVHEHSRPGTHMRLTFEDSDDHFPVWFPDSQRFLFADRVEDDTFSTRFVFKTLKHRADGAGRPEPWPRTLPEVSPLSVPMVVLDGGRRVLYQEAPNPETHWDIADSSRPWSQRYIVQSPALEEDPVLSRDGRWLAYSSLESGVRQIYVRPFPDTQSARWQVTTAGGNQPLWAPDGSELYYRNGTAMMAVSIQTDPVFRAGSPVKLFEGDFHNQDSSRRDYDLDYPEGRRFLMVEDYEPEVASTKLIYVENWAEELERLVPVE
jgi:serine/threonine-protein kinase